MTTCRTIFSRVSFFLHPRGFLRTRSPLSCHQQCATLKVKVIEKLGINLPPKKPLVPFFKFKAKLLPKIRAENPNMKLTEISKLLALEWEKCPPEQKQLLQEEAAAEYVEYRKDLEDYKKSLKPDDIELIEKTRQKMKRNKQNQLRRQKLISLNKPKKPATVYSLYFRQKVLENPTTENKASIMKKASEEWKTLSHDEKKKYIQEYSESMKEYRRKLEEWEAEMFEEGNLDVLGTKTLRRLHKEHEKENKK